MFQIYVIKMNNSIKENLKIFGCFIGLYIFQFYLIKYAISLVQLQSTFTNIAAIAIMVSVTIFILWFYIKMSGLDTFRYRGIRIKAWLWALILCISQFLLTSLLFSYPAWINPNNIPYGHIIFSFYAIFCHSIASEILFRGILQKQLSKISAPWLAIAITTIVNMLVSIMFVPNIFQAFLAGIFIGIIYYKTDKLILGIFYRALQALLFSITQFSYGNITLMRLAFFLIVTVLAVYVINRFMKDNLLMNKAN